MKFRVVIQKREVRTVNRIITCQVEIQGLQILDSHFEQCDQCDLMCTHQHMLRIDEIYKIVLYHSYTVLKTPNL